MGPTPGQSFRLPDSDHTRPPLSLPQRLKRHGLSADKKFGQHFLVSESVIAKIVAAASGLAGILEVGPGPGVLTGPLSSQAQVTALELDTKFWEILAETAPSAKILMQDALEADWLEILESLPSPKGIVSNMPYNITGPLLAKAAGVRDQISWAVLMMQREVGDRILAPAGDSNRGALSVCLQSQFTIEKVCLVPPGAFLPPPKVDSIVLKLTPRPAPALDDGIVHRAFTQPRKTLLNNLKPDGLTSAIMESIGLAPSVRPHQLEEADWWKITTALRQES